MYIQCFNEFGTFIFAEKVTLFLFFRKTLNIESTSCTSLKWKKSAFVVISQKIQNWSAYQNQASPHGAR